MDSDDWNPIQKKAKAFLGSYCALDVHSIVDSEPDFALFKAKFDLWIELTWVRLDNGSPLPPQRAKLNEASVQLANGHL